MMESGEPNKNKSVGREERVNDNTSMNKEGFLQIDQGKGNHREEVH